MSTKYRPQPDVSACRCTVPEDVLDTHLEATEFHGADQPHTFGQRYHAGTALFVLIRQPERVVHQLESDAVEA